MHGVIAPGVVPAILGKVYTERRTGTLSFASGTRHCAFRAHYGQVVRAEASEPDLHMGEVMVARGLLTEDLLELATRTVRRRGRRLGEVLVDMRALDQPGLDGALVIHVCEVLAAVLRWREGTFVLEDADADEFLEGPDHPLPMATAAMLLEAVQLVQDRDAVRFGLGEFDDVLLPSDSAVVRFQRVDMAPIDAFVMSRVDGSASIRQVIEVTSMDEQAVESSLFRLLCLGMLERPPKPARTTPRPDLQMLRQEMLDACADLPTRNAFEVLGIAPDAPPAEIKAAYLRLARRWHPDVCHEAALRDVQTRAEALFRRLNEAYEQLSNPRTLGEERARYGPRVAGAMTPVPPAPVLVQPDELFQRAKERFEGGRYWEAVALLGETVRLAEGSLRPRARVLLARAHLKSADGIKLAEKELLTAIGESPSLAEAYFVLGGLYERASLPSRARTMYRKALELNPRSRAVAAALQKLDQAAGA